MPDFVRNLAERYRSQSPLNRVMSAWRMVGLLPLTVVLVLIAVGVRDPWVFTAATVVLLANVPPHLYYYFRDSAGRSARRSPRQIPDDPDDDADPRGNPG